MQNFSFANTLIFGSVRLFTSVWHHFKHLDNFKKSYT